MTGPEQHPRLASSDNQALSKPHIPTGPNARSTFHTILADRDRSAKSALALSPRSARIAARSRTAGRTHAARDHHDRYDPVVRLTAWEEDRLLIFTAAELARRHRDRGLALNHPEAVALICDAMLEAARAGGSYEEVERAGREAVAADDLMPGVAGLIDEVRLEVLLDDGTRLVVLDHPVAPSAGEIVPGEVTLAAGRADSDDDRERRTVQVRNDGRRVVRVSSHYPFHLVNPRLVFDRSVAEGFRLDLPAGSAERWSPGETREVVLVRLGGTGAR